MLTLRPARSSAFCFQPTALRRRYASSAVTARTRSDRLTRSAGAHERRSCRLQNHAEGCLTKIMGSSAHQVEVGNGRLDKACFVDQVWPHLLRHVPGGSVVQVPSLFSLARQRSTHALPFFSVFCCASARGTGRENSNAVMAMAPATLSTFTAFLPRRNSVSKRRARWLALISPMFADGKGHSFGACSSP
jgi:hypothetical protein